MINATRYSRRGLFSIKPSSATTKAKKLMTNKMTQIFLNDIFMFAKSLKVGSVYIFNERTASINASPAILQFVRHEFFTLSLHIL